VVRKLFADWQRDDPEWQPVETFKRVRYEVKQRVEKLIQSLN